MNAEADKRRGWDEGVRVGRFRVVRRLGAGGMGEVWEAVDTVLGRRVALKRLLPELKETSDLARLQREAKTQASLSSPHIASLHGLEQVERENGTEVFLVMEFVEGRSVARMLEDGPLPVDMALSLFAQLCLALRAAHSAGVVHRDLKPSNLLVRSDGTLVVVDFGIAIRPEDTEGDSLTRTGAVVGSTAYLSPEQAEGRPVGPASDIWSAAVTLYEMLAGARPFRGNTRAATVAAILRDAPEPIRHLNPDVPRDVARLVGRCLAKRPEDRPPDAIELLDQLPAIPIPIAGRRGMIFEPELLARGAAHPPLGRAARALAPLAVLAAFGLLWWTSGQSWRSPGPWPRLDEVEGRSVVLLDELGLLHRGANRLAGYRADRTGLVRTWFRMRPAPFYVERAAPAWDHPRPVPGEVRLAYDVSGELRSFEQWPDDRLPGAGATSQLLEAMGLAGEAAGAHTGEFERGQPVFRRVIEDVPVEVVGTGRHVLRVSRMDQRLREPLVEAPIDRGRPEGIVILVAVVALALFQARRGGGDRRGALVFGGLLLVLHWVQLLVLPRMWVEGGWREVIGEGARAGVMAATAYYGMEPIIRKRWPGLLVGWGRLVRWRGRDPVLGREVLLGLATLLPFALVLAVARVHLGAGEALVRVPVVAFAGRPLAWASGFGGIAVAGAALVIAGLFASAIAHHVVRVPWVALTVGMGLSAWGLGAICAWGSWLVVAANLLVLVALAYRGGLIALVTFQHGAIGLAGILPISAGPALLPFTLVGFAFYVALVALGLWLGAPRKALTTSRRSPHPPGGPAEPSPEPCASAEPETDAARTRPARRRRAPKTETLTED